MIASSPERAGVSVCPIANTCDPASRLRRSPSSQHRGEDFRARASPNVPNSHKSLVEDSLPIQRTVTVILGGFLSACKVTIPEAVTSVSPTLIELKATEPHCGAIR